MFAIEPCDCKIASDCDAEKMKVPTSTVAALFWNIALTGQRIAMAAFSFREKTQGQQLKGKFVSEIFTLFIIFPLFSLSFPQDFPLQNKGL